MLIAINFNKKFGPHLRCRELLWCASIFIGLSYHCAVADSIPDSSQIRHYFEWGNYDKLIQIIEPYLASAKDSAKLYISECHKYLGVAYFARSRIADARKQFELSYRTNQSIVLDRFYVSPEIYDFFSKTVSETKDELSREAQKDSLLRIAELQLKKNEITLQEIKSKRITIFYTALYYSLAAIAGGAAYYSSSLADQDYSKWNTARINGDLVTYGDKALVKKINWEDAASIGGEVGCALFVVPGTYFLCKALGIAGTPSPRDAKVEINWYGPEIVLAF